MPVANFIGILQSGKGKISLELKKENQVRSSWKKREKEGRGYENTIMSDVTSLTVG